MIGQLEFETMLQELGAHGPELGKLKKPKPGMNTQTFTIGLARALRKEYVAHSLFNLLTVVGCHQVKDGHTTIPRVALALGVTFNAIQQHLIKSGHFFEVNRKRWGKAGMNLLTLSPEGIALLVKIQKTADTYAKQPV